jgi:hypothetical protein
MTTDDGGPLDDCDIASEIAEQERIWLATGYDHPDNDRVLGRTGTHSGRAESGSPRSLCQSTGSLA